MYQKTVHANQSLGQPGEFYDDSPRRVTSWPGDHIDGQTEVIGRVFTFDASGLPVPGGDGAFAGILVGPNSHARIGLAPSTALGRGAALGLADLGRVIVTTSGAASPNTAIMYDKATGLIAGTAAAELPAGKILLKSAKFFRFSSEANGLAVVEINLPAL